MNVRRNFFSDMRYIEDAKQRGKLSSRGESIFEGLVSFVEGCEFTKSKHSKFLCENWRLDVDSLVELWSRRTGQTKAHSTFRDAISNTGAVLYDMFPKFSRELFVSELDNPDIQSGYDEIELVVSMLSGSECYPQDLFVPQVVNYVDPGVDPKEFNIEDCKDVIQALKPLLQQQVYNYLDGVDFDKLSYVLNVLSRPLVKSKVRGVNREKLWIMRELGLVEGGVLPVSDVATPEVRVEKVYIEKPEKIPYSLAVTKAVSNILTERINSKVTVEDVKNWQSKTPEVRQRSMIAMIKILNVMTENGFRDWVNKQYPLALAEVVDGKYDIEGVETKSYRV